jgi:hypothetical protein
MIRHGFDDLEDMKRLNDLVEYFMGQLCDSSITHEKNDFCGMRMGAEVHFDTKRGLYIHYKGYEEEWGFDNPRNFEMSNKYCWIPELLMNYFVSEWVDDTIRNLKDNLD